MSPTKVTLPSGEVRWSVRYRDPSGKQPQRRFTTRAAAARFEAATRTAITIGAYVEPGVQRQTFRAYAEQHWAVTSGTLRADTTRPTKRARLDRHILPALGDHPIGSITPTSRHPADPDDSHVRVSVFAGPDRAHRALAGVLTFRRGEDDEFIRRVEDIYQPTTERTHP